MVGSVSCAAGSAEERLACGGGEFYVEEHDRVGVDEARDGVLGGVGILRRTG